MTIEPTTPTGFDNDELLLMPSFRERVLNLEPSGSKTTLFGTILVEVDMTDATVMRDRLAERWERSFGVPLTFNHMVLKAVAAALTEHPIFRPTELGGNHDSWGHVDLGVSVLSDNGVVTAVLRSASSLSLPDISAQVGGFYERVAEGRHVEEHLPNGCFVVTNLGKYGVDAMTLRADPPAAGVIGVGRCVRKPVMVEEEVKPRWMMTLSLSFDGKTLNGAKAAQFLGLIKDKLERPTLLVQ